MDDLDLISGIYRRLYSGAIRGRRINRVSVLAELIFWRAHLVADDYGVFETDPVLFRAQALTLRGGISEADVDSAIAELAEAKLISRYEVRGEPYAVIIDFVKLQPGGRNGRRIRKFPADPGASSAIPVHPGESGGIQNDPGASSNSERHNNNNNNQDHNQHHGGASGESNLLDEVQRQIDPVIELVNAWPALLVGGMARIGPAQRGELERLIEVAGGVEAAKQVMAEVAQEKARGRQIRNVIKYALGIAEAQATEKDLQGRAMAVGGRRKAYHDQ